MSRRIIGLTGHFQAGKQELGHVFTGAGWAFIDLNVFAERARLEDNDVHRAYEREGLLGTILPNGRRNPLYYQKVAHVHGTHARIMDAELPVVTRMTRKVLASHEGDALVLNWGYLYRMLGDLPLDHVLVFQSNKDIWYQRIRRRIIAMGWPPETSLTDDQILEFIQGTEMEPERVLGAVSSRFPDQHTVFDTSAPDWGEEALRAYLTSLNDHRP